MREWVASWDIINLMSDFLFMCVVILIYCSTAHQNTVVSRLKAWLLTILTKSRTVRGLFSAEITSLTLITDPTAFIAIATLCHSETTVFFCCESDKLAIKCPF